MFYIAVLIVLTVIFNLLYLSYAIGQKHSVSQCYLKCLRIVCNLCVTNLFLPFVELFLSMLNCNSKNGNVNSVVNELECWKGLHILYCVSAVIVAILFLLMTTIAVTVLSDISWNNKNSLSKFTSSVDLFHLLSKMLWALCFTFFNKEKYEWALIALLLGTSAVFFHQEMTVRPYVSPGSTLVWCLVGGVFAWTNGALFFASVLAYSDFRGGFELCFAAYPLVVLAVVCSPNPFEKRLMTRLSALRNAGECFELIRCYVCLVESESFKSKVVLRGYFKKFNEDEEGDEVRYERLRGKKEVKLDKLKVHIEYAFHLFKEAIERFPESAFLKIQYALFLIEKQEDKNLVLRELLCAARSNPSLAEQFTIFRFR